MANIGCGLDYDATLGTGTAGGGLASVATWGALPAASGSGDERLVLNSGLRVTDCDVEGVFLWLPSEAVRKADGTLYTLAWARDGAGEKAKVFPGDTVPGGWTVSGTLTTGGGVVTVSGYAVTAIVSTASRALIVAQYHALPHVSVAESGIAGGTVVSGTARWHNTRLTSGGIVTQGLYRTLTSKGRLVGGAGLPIFGLLDQSAATGPLRSWSAGGGPGEVVTSDRTDMSTSGAYFQVMSVDAMGTGVSQELDYAGLVVMT